MSKQATATFEMKSWDEKTWDGRPWQDAVVAKACDHLFADVDEVGNLREQGFALMTERDTEAANPQDVSD